MLCIGNTIRRLRIQKDISQKSLAKLTGLTPSYLSLLERGHREPSLAVIRRIASGLDVPEEVLIWDAVRLPSDLSDEDRRVCEMAKLLVRRFYEVTEIDSPEEFPDQIGQTCRT